jgi:hypothetical protein
LLGCYGCFEAHHPDDLVTLPTKLLLQHTAICIQVEAWLPETFPCFSLLGLQAKTSTTWGAIWYWRKFALFNAETKLSGPSMSLHSPSKSKNRTRLKSIKTEQPSSDFVGRCPGGFSLDTLVKRMLPIFGEAFKLKNFPFVVLLVLSAASLLSRIWLMRH